MPEIQVAYNGETVYIGFAPRRLVTGEAFEFLWAYTKDKNVESLWATPEMPLWGWAEAYIESGINDAELARLPGRSPALPRAAFAE